MNNKIKEWKEAQSSFTFNESFVYKEIKRCKSHLLFTRILKVCASSFAIIFILANTSTSYIQATRNIPFINDLNELLNINPSVLNAIENDYIQELNITKEDGDFKVVLESMVIDQKSVYLFYKPYYKGEILSLKADDDGPYSIGFVGLAHETSIQTSFGWNYLDDYNVAHFTIGATNIFQKFEMKDFTLEIGYKDNIVSFDIDVDKSKFETVKEIDVNQIINIKGHKFEIDKVEIYPLSLRVYTKQDLNNIALIREMNFEIQNQENVIENREWIYNQKQYMYSMESPYFNDDNYELYLKSVSIGKKVATATLDTTTMEWNDPSGLTTLYKTSTEHPHGCSIKIKTNKFSDPNFILVDYKNEAEFVNITESFIDEYNMVSFLLPFEEFEENKVLEFNIYEEEIVEVNKKIKLK